MDICKCVETFHCSDYHNGWVVAMIFSEPESSINIVRETFLYKALLSLKTNIVSIGKYWFLVHFFFGGGVCGQCMYIINKYACIGSQY